MSLANARGVPVDLDRLNGRRAPAYSKKAKEGREKRLSLLRPHFGYGAEAHQPEVRVGCQLDDVDGAIGQDPDGGALSVRYSLFHHAMRSEPESKWLRSPAFRARSPRCHGAVNWEASYVLCRCHFVIVHFSGGVRDH